MTMEEARALVGSPVWGKVRDEFLATGVFVVHPKDDPSRLAYLDDDTRRAVELWLDALEHVDEWKTVVAGGEVRALKERYPGVYPEVFRYQAYFARFKARPDRFAATRLILKLRFPDAYRLCFTS